MLHVNAHVEEHTRAGPETHSSVRVEEGTKGVESLTSRQDRPAPQVRVQIGLRGLCSRVSDVSETEGYRFVVLELCKWGVSHNGDLLSHGSGSSTFKVKVSAGVGFSCVLSWACGWPSPPSVLPWSSLGVSRAQPRLLRRTPVIGLGRTPTTSK